jgi:hypothetical protein
MTGFAKAIFVSASWCPIYLLIAVLAWDDSHAFSYAALLVAILSVLGIVFTEFLVRTRHAKEYISVKRAVHKKDDIFMYVITYIPPFFAVDAKSASKIIALCLLYAFIFASYIRLHQYHLNPLFVFFGYKVYAVKTEEDVDIYVIVTSKQTIADGDRIRICTIGDLAIMA